MLVSTNFLHFSLDTGICFMNLCVLLFIRPGGLITSEMIVALIFCMSISSCLYFEIISKILGGTLQSVGTAVSTIKRILCFYLC